MDREGGYWRASSCYSQDRIQSVRRPPLNRFLLGAAQQLHSCEGWVRKGLSHDEILVRLTVRVSLSPWQKFRPFVKLLWPSQSASAQLTGPWDCNC